jgi:hypothetical protein
VDGDGVVGLPVEPVAPERNERADVTLVGESAKLYTGNGPYEESDGARLCMLEEEKER